MNGNDNYEIEVYTGELTITKASGNVVVLPSTGSSSDGAGSGSGGSSDGSGSGSSGSAGTVVSNGTTLDATYNGQDVLPAFGASAAGSTVLYSLDGGVTWTSEKPSLVDAGTYELYIKTVHEGYEDSEPIRYTLTIGKLPVTITVNDATMKDGKLVGTLGGTVTGLLSGQSVAGLAYKLVAGSYTAGVYNNAVTAMYGDNPNFAITVIPGKLVVQGTATAAGTVTDDNGTGVASIDAEGTVTVDTNQGVSVPGTSKANTAAGTAQYDSLLLEDQGAVTKLLMNSFLGGYAREYAEFDEKGVEVGRYVLFDWFGKDVRVSALDGTVHWLRPAILAPIVLVTAYFGAVAYQRRRELEEHFLELGEEAGVTA
jgi:hypothetical protein